VGKWKNRLLRYWTYFRRGHGTYLVFLLSFSNFVVIQYRLLVESVPVLKGLFPSLLFFVLIFLPTYVVAAILIGWMDYRRLAVPIDAALMAKASPWVRDLARALMALARGRNEEAARILAKWVDEDVGS